MPVIDKTGLSGKFDFDLAIPIFSLDAPVEVQAGGRSFTVARGSHAEPKSASAALEKQLGLKLNPVKLKVDLIVVDHLERTPTEN